MYWPRLPFAAHRLSLQTRRGTLRTRSSAGGFVAAGYIHGYASSMPAMPPWRSRATSAYQNPEWGNPSATLFPAPNPGYQFTHYSEYPHESALSPLSGNVSVRGEFAPNRPFTLTTSAIIHGDKNGLPADFDPNGLLRVDTMKSGYWANGQARVEIPANLPHGLAFSHWEAVGNPGQQQPGPEKDARYWLSDEFAVNVKPAECPEVVAVLTRPEITAVEWRPFEDYANIEDPPAGEGQAIFPGAATPSGAARNRVRVRAQVAATTARTRVYFRLFDVDDPSSDTAPIDPNGPDGNDNIDQSAQLSQQSALCTVASANFSGYAEVTLDNVSMRPGDNYRVAVSLVESALQPHNYPLGNANSGTDPADGAITEMLTVWRRLHIEEYEMGAPVPGDPFGLLEGSVLDQGDGWVRVNLGPILNVGHDDDDPVPGAVVAFNRPQTDDDEPYPVVPPTNAVEPGISWEVLQCERLGNNEYKLHLDGNFPHDRDLEEYPNPMPFARCILNTDDPEWTGGPPNTVESLRPFFNGMFIHCERLGERQTVPFVHHQPDVALVPVNHAGSPAFWTVSLQWAYEPENRVEIACDPPKFYGDGDPQNKESGTLGEADGIPGERVMVWVEIHRESRCGEPDAQGTCDLILTAAHEIGHTLGLEHAPIVEAEEDGKLVLVPVDEVNDDGLMRWKQAGEQFPDLYKLCDSPPDRILPPWFTQAFSPNNRADVRAHYQD